MTDTQENWKTGSGLIDEFDITITDAEFRTNPKVGDGEIPILHIIGLNSVTGDPEDDVRFKVGATFEIAEGGKRVVPIQPKAKINRNGQYGKFIDAFLECDGANDVIAARSMDPLVAASWIGLTLSLERVIRKVKIDNEQVDMTEWIVHGIEVADGGTKKKTSRKKAAAAKAPEAAQEAAAEATEDVPADAPTEAAPAAQEATEAPAAEAAPAEGIPTRFAAAARGIAKASDTYEAFVDKTYEDIEGILNQPWEEELVSREFYAAARGE